MTAAPAPATPEVLAFFKALADETRLAILRLLALTDLRGGEIGERLHLPSNALSYHLKQLRALGLLRQQRSAFDARDIYVGLDVARLQELYAAAGEALRLVPTSAPAALAPGADPDERPLRVLFLCTHNSARSQLAEGLVRLLAGDRVAVASAGSAPTAVHPIALALLREWGLDPIAYSSKALEGFVGTPFDYIITVCDRVREECPAFPEDPLRLHWSLPDPALAGDEAAQWAAFRAVGSTLRVRLAYLLAQPHPATGRRLLPPPAAGAGSAA